jgi:hypothetical protein
VRNGYRWTLSAITAAAAMIVATGCGTSGSGDAAAPPPKTSPASTSAAPAPSASTQRDQAWQAIDPCTLLQPAQLKPFLGGNPPQATRDDADGKHTCAWGDGEFRSVRVSVWQPASAAELTDGAVRQVSVGGHTAQVVHDGDYTCELQTGDERAAVNLQTVTMDEIKLCPDATTAFTAVVAKLRW